MITSAEIRAKLVDALQLDLVGPTPDDGEHAHEVLIQPPSKWYLCGFLAPFGAAIDLKSDETVDEELDQQAGNAASEDAAVPEAAAARKVPFPSLMGLSFLVSEQVTERQLSVGATICRSTSKRRKPRKKRRSSASKSAGSVSLKKQS